MMDQETLPIPRASPFFGTDLIIFKDSYKGKLPLNGVRETVYRERVKVYLLICRNQSNMRIEGDFPFHVLIRMCFRFLLTRDASAELVHTFVQMKLSSKIVIKKETETTSSNAKCKNGVLTISMQNTRHDYISCDSAGNKKRLEQFFPIVLAHEMIHVVHNNFTENEVFFPPTLSTRFSNLEEQLTITGVGKERTEPLNENRIRSAFGLGFRISHEAVMFMPSNMMQYENNALPKEVFNYLCECARVGLVNEIERFFISQPKLNLQTLKYEGQLVLEIFCEEAVEGHDLPLFKKVVQWGLKLDFIPKNDLNFANYGLLQWIVVKGAGALLKYCISELKENFNPKIRDASGGNLLHLVSDVTVDRCHDETSRPEMATMLILWGVPPQGRNNNRETPFHYAVRHAHVNLLHVLGNSTSSLNTRNREGETPLHTAANGTSGELVKALLYEKRILPFEKTARGKTFPELLEQGEMNQKSKKEVLTIYTVLRVSQIPVPKKSAYQYRGLQVVKVAQSKLE
jgi:hypothetical protein